MIERVERIELAPGYSISRLLKGGWHLAGGHGAVDPQQAIKDMAQFVEAGITSFDCADHYIGVEMLDLVQFFWWDWGISGAIEAAQVLAELRRAGKIRLIGATNFNTDQFSALIDAGVPMSVHQIQYSLVDRRPDWRMREFCRERGIAVLTYGHLLGGFFSLDWLGKDEPTGPFSNRSLTKYKLIIDEFGGWALFQKLLAAMARIGERHGVEIGQVALRWTLDRPGVAGCIVGATSTRHLSANLRVFDLALTDEDRAELAVVTDERRGPPGDCYQLENDRNGPHGRIMRYNQNAL